MDITFLFIVSMGVLLRIPKSLLMNQQGFERCHTPYPMPDHPAIESPGLIPLTYRDLRLQIMYVVKTLNIMGFYRYVTHQTADHHREGG
jgi:hypothetical protein